MEPEQALTPIAVTVKKLARVPGTSDKQTRRGIYPREFPVEARPRTSEVRDPSTPSVVDSAVDPLQEYFVDASVAAEYLHCSRKHILRLSRHGVIPAHPISFGRRITWRYLLSELRAWVLSNRAPVNVAENGASGRRIAGGSPRKGGR